MATVFRPTFHVADYILFVITMVIPLGIGLFYALYGDRQKTTAEYFVGGRKMKFLPVAISLLVSFESGILMLGMPAEVYVYGMQYTIIFLGYFTAHLLSVFLIVPVLFPLKLTSAFEYLEYRFESRSIRLLGTSIQIISTLWYMSVVIFGPAIALEAVTQFSQYWSICIVSVVGVIFTSMGGIKAVIWADVFQFVIMFSGLFATLIKGTIDGGGATEVWSAAKESGRLNFFNFDPDPTVRHTFWNLYFGTTFHAFWVVFNQSTIQRIAATKTLTDAKRVMMFMAPLFSACCLLASIQGVVAFAYFDNKKCDPLASGQIKNPNQVVPFLVMDIFRSLQGMPGLFLASLFSASLSTLSTGLSSLSAVTWQDILKPLLPTASEVKATVIAKISVFVYGAVACGLSFLISTIGGPLTQIYSSLSPAFSGPLTGLFLLGMLFPWANSKGALSGGLLSIVFVSWISFGQNFSKVVKMPPRLQPASTDQCPVENNTFISTTPVYVNDTMTTWSPTPADDDPQGVEKMYTLSYRWFSAVAVLLVLIIGSLVSLLTGCNRDREVDPKYLVRIGDNLCCCLPAKIKNVLNYYHTDSGWKTSESEESECASELHAEGWMEAQTRPISRLPARDLPLMSEVSEI